MQSIIFREKNHPNNINFTQCVSLEWFSTESKEKLFIIFCLTTMYFIPLMVIVYVYARIFHKINIKSREWSGKQT